MEEKTVEPTDYEKELKSYRFKTNALDCGTFTVEETA